MSFSSEVKTELCTVKIPRCCKLPLVYGFLLFSRSFSVTNIKMQTGTKAVADLFSRLIGEVYDADCIVNEGGGKRTVYRLQISNEAERLKLLASVDFGIYEGKINKDIFTRDCCVASFIRGAFLACGQLSDPEKSFRADFLIRDRSRAEEFREILRENYIKTNISPRGTGYSVYIKQNEMITNLLTLMGASGRSLELIEKSILKSVNNNINRAQNCDNANLDRMVEASVNQRRAIDYLDKKGILGTLSGELQFAASLRRNNPDMSIKELCRVSELHISPSGLNHRLKKLIDIYNSKK